MVGGGGRKLAIYCDAIICSQTRRWCEGQSWVSAKLRPPPPPISDKKRAVPARQKRVNNWKSPTTTTTTTSPTPVDNSTRSLQHNVWLETKSKENTGLGRARGPNGLLDRL